MTSAEPVDITAMRKRMAYPPVVPSNFWATGGAEVGQPHGGGQGEGDGKPDQSACYEAPDSLQRLSCH